MLESKLNYPIEEREGPTDGGDRDRDRCVQSVREGPNLSV